MKKFLIIISVVILGGLGYFGYQYFYGNPLSYVTIEINPSVQLGLEGDEVVEALPLNEDADIILNDLDLVGLSIDDATEKIIDSATETGYIDEFSDDNAITVTAYSDSDRVRDRIQDKVVDNIDSVLSENKIYAEILSTGVTDEMKDEADEYDISYGKMLLVERAVAVDSALTKDDLVDLSVKEIQTKIKDAVDNRHAKMSENKEQLKEMIQTKVENKIQAKQDKLLQVKEEIKTENQTDLKDKSKAEQDEIIKEKIIEKKEAIVEKAKGNTSANNGNKDNDNSNSKR